MRKFRSKEKGPLPIELRSGPISVASKGYFEVSEDDVQSPDLLKKVGQRLVEPVEEKAVMVAPEEPVKVIPVELEPEVAPVVEQQEEVLEEAETADPEEPVDVTDGEKHDDSLTTSSEMVESENDETGSGDAVPAGGKKPRKGSRSGGNRRHKKKGITG